MLRPEDERELRQRVRRSLEDIKGEAGEDGQAPPSQADVERLQAILNEETEAYYQRKGLVKHISRTGRVHWVTPEEEEALSKRRRRRSRKGESWWSKLDRRVIFVWVATALFAAVLLAYLIKTEVIG